MVKFLCCRNFQDIQKQLYNDEGVITVTSIDQKKTEEIVLRKYQELSYRLKIKSNIPELLKDQHKEYLFNSLFYLNSSYQSLDSSRPWLVYWILHPLSLMSTKLDSNVKKSVANFIGKCQCKDGGFGGGPSQLPHLAATYAAVNALVILGTEDAYNIINLKKLKNFLFDMRQSDGSFTIHKDGEVDIRGAYCALAIASITNLMSDELFEGTAEWIVSCQTYEGGFSGYPGMEAHGGYGFCGTAGLILLRKAHLCDYQSLLRWLVNKQMKLEGGFQGRTNKLVDACYSFWQGGLFPLIYNLLTQNGIDFNSHLFDARALQEYILICCQTVRGGLLDKPGKPIDIYHTCYALSGLAIAQYFKSDNYILANISNELECTHPIYSIRPEYVRKAMIYYRNLNL